LRSGSIFYQLRLFGSIFFNRAQNIVEDRDKELRADREKHDGFYNGIA